LYSGQLFGLASKALNRLEEKDLAECLMPDRKKAKFCSIT